AEDGIRADLVTGVQTCALPIFASLRTRFLARFALLGREVELLEAKRRIAGGVAVDIDAAGRLLVRTDAGTRAFAGGEVSLRPVQIGRASCRERVEGTVRAIARE